MPNAKKLLQFLWTPHWQWLLQYGFRGYSTQTHSKLTWPMVLMTTSLRMSPVQFIQDSLSLEFLERFALALQNLFLTHLELTMNLSTVAMKEQIWRGLLLSSCGPAVIHKEGFASLMNLLWEDLFDFVLAFGGSSMIGHQIRNMLFKAIEHVAIDKTGDLWNVLLQAICHNLHLLQTNSIVILFKECHGPNSKPTDFDMLCSPSGIRMKCRLCSWGLPKVTSNDTCEYVTPMDRSFPNVFWHSYPVSAPLAALFVTTMGHEKHHAPLPGKKGKKN
ncbi:hypothetical protein HD554DRAFT_2038321 [Boletus coccyginus]|nr:hypothetical protein HD554DRAFT_2038321 [Boletus coccyginus]